MTIYQFITFISWSFASSLLLIFTIVAAIIYQDNRQKVFQFYALYCFLMLLYALTKIPDFFYPLSKVWQWKGHNFYQSYYWIIQVLFHNAYLSFAIYFLDLKKIRPKITRQITNYQKIIISSFSFLTLLVLVGVVNSEVLVWSFSFVFIELHLIICFLVIFAARKTHYFLRNYFVLGSLIYMSMILFSFALTALKLSLGIISPPAIFYAAISLECCLFSAGLGIQVRNIYRQKMKFQTDLNLALQKVQMQMGLQLEQEKLTTQNTQLNSQVLRSQMNSHFIFNVLNSIKLFVRETETEKALLYLGKFARFIRCVLDGRIYESHSLEKELETLELYLSIEKMRFNDELEYSISVEEGITLSNIPFPALLLQPFVENALWHGLHQKQGSKKIEIRVSGSAQCCFISIRDNGVGVAIAAKQKLTQDSPTSEGLNIVDKRIAFFNMNNSTRISYKAVDHEEGMEISLSMIFGDRNTLAGS